MRLFIFSFILFILSVSAQAQRVCFSKNDQLSSNSQPTLSIPGQNNGVAPDQLVVIPVIVHVVYNLAVENISDDQINSQIEALNADFSRSNNDFSKVPSVFAKYAANSNIRFELAKTNPMGQTTTGIIRKKTTRMMWSDDDKIKYEANGGSTTWDSKSYLNVWICNTVPGLTGYATFPGGNIAVDGIVVRYDAFGTRGRVSAPFNKGRTLTHEVGHWLGLKHLWGDQTCGDDGIDDTPKQRAANTGDPVFPRNTTCNTTPEGEMFMNFMDFTNDASMGMFTEGQKSIMRSQFYIGSSRNTFLKSKGLAEAWNNNVELNVMPVNTHNIAVYPNPVTKSSNKITLLVNTPMDNNGKHFAIISSSGQIVKTGHIQEMQQDIDVQSLSPGMYSIRLTDVASNAYTKFIKN